MTPNLPFPHFTFSLSAIMQHPLFWVALVLLILTAFATAWRTARALFGLGVVGALGYGLYALANSVNHAMNGTHGKTSWIVMPALNGTNKASSLPVLQVHALSGGLIVVLLIVALVGLIFFGAVKSSGYSPGYVFNRLWVFFTGPIHKGGRGETYSFPDVTMGVGIGEAEPNLPGSSHGAGKRVVMEAKDRFLNTGIIGPIGSGKTFMTMKPMIYQDLEALAKGVMESDVADLRLRYFTPGHEIGVVMLISRLSRRKK